MSEVFEKFYNSLVHHGKLNDKVYLMKLDTSKVSETIDYINSLAVENNHSKILSKVPKENFELFKKNKFTQEAIVPNFFKGKKDGVFASKFFTKEREIQKDKDTAKIVLEACQNRKADLDISLKEGFECQMLAKSDIKAITTLYKNVFETYPFPIFKEEYILKTMSENICYFGIKKDNKLVSIASTEIDEDNLNVEMTDFATLEEYRGNDFSYCLLKKMESYSQSIGLKTAYAMARATSFGMNITFKKRGYNFAGTLTNNSNIGGSIESLNVWYKNL